MIEARGVLPDLQLVDSSTVEAIRKTHRNCGCPKVKVVKGCTSKSHQRCQLSEYLKFTMAHFWVLYEVTSAETPSRLKPTTTRKNTRHGFVSQAKIP